MILKMYKYFKILALCGLVSFLLSCQSGSQEAATETTKPKASVIEDLKPLPQNIKQNLLEKCDYIDYTFYNFDFSMSQSEPGAIQANLALLSEEVQPNIPAECKPIGRKYYHINGEIVMEAELYFGENCLFYIYKDDNTTLFGNKLSGQGVNFYNNVIQQASAARQQPQG